MRQRASDNLLEVILTQDESDDRAETPNPTPCCGSMIGEFLGWGRNGEPLVKFGIDPAQGSVCAQATVLLGQGDIGRGMVLVFEDGNPLKPIIVGVLQPQLSAAPKQQITTSSLSVPLGTVEADDETIVFTAQKKIVFKCGKASLTLTQDGRVLIRGTYLSSQSSGPNLIKGGSVQLN